MMHVLVPLHFLPSLFLLYPAGLHQEGPPYLPRPAQGFFPGKETYFQPVGLWASVKKQPLLLFTDIIEFDK